MPSPSNRSPLQRAVRQILFGLALLLLAGLRHHLVWGESPRLPFSLKPLLDAGETVCLVGFAWFGARGWWLGMQAVRDASPGTRALLRASVPLLAVAIAVPAFLSNDVADYVMRGRVLALHGGNPYLQVATDFPGDAFLEFGDASWKDFPLPYGPLLANLQGAIAWLGHCFSFLPPLGEFLLTVVLFKVVFAGCLVLSALLARDLGERLRPGSGDVAFVAVLWNPLLLNEGLATAHNESVVLLLLLLAVRAALALRLGASTVGLGLGVLAKIVPVLLAPLLLVWAVRNRRLAGLALGVAGTAALGALAWWQFFREPGSLDFLQRQSGVKLGSLVWAAEALFGIPAGAGLTVGRAFVLLVAAIVTVQLWRAPTGERLVHGAACVLAAMVCLGLAGFGAWYHIWWIVLALLAGNGWLRRFAVAATVLSPLGYVVWTGWRTLGDVHQATGLAMGIVVPALVAFAWRARREPAAPIVPSQ